MRSAIGPLVTLAATVLFAVALASGGATGADAGSDPHLVELYPNPVAPGDPGEYVTVYFPTETALDGWALADRYDREPLPNVTVEGRVAFSPDPDVAATHTDDPVHSVGSGIRLADAEDTIELHAGDDVIDETSYKRAPQSQVWTRTDDGWTWVPLGATDRPVERFEDQTVTTFVLPDGHEIPDEVLRGAEDRILLAAYTLSDEETTRELVDAVDRGVEVDVLVEGGPAGGVSKEQGERLDELAESGVNVTVLTGPKTRYRFHHAKYAVADDRAVVLTENWSPTGVGGGSNRGWGIVLDGEPAEALAETFEKDAGWRDGVEWTDARDTIDRHDQPTEVDTYPEEFDIEEHPADSIEIVVAPENAEDELLDRLDDAETSITIQQLSVREGHPFLDALVDAAARGVDVEVQLSGEWYVREDNAAVADALDRKADREDLPIETRLIESSSRFETVHTKGIVIDDRTTVIGSVNWTNTSIRENREVAVIVDGEPVAGYYTDAMRADATDADEPGTELPIEVVVVTVGVVIGTGLALRRWTPFEEER